MRDHSQKFHSTVRPPGIVALHEQHSLRTLTIYSAPIAQFRAFGSLMSQPFILSRRIRCRISFELEQLNETAFRTTLDVDFFRGSSHLTRFWLDTKCVSKSS